MRTLVPSVTGCVVDRAQKLLPPAARAGAVGQHDDGVEAVRVVERAQLVERMCDRRVDRLVAVGFQIVDRAGHGRPSLAERAERDLCLRSRRRR